jgi:hypothetical protein
MNIIQKNFQSKFLPSGSEAFCRCKMGFIRSFCTNRKENVWNTTSEFQEEFGLKNLLSQKHREEQKNDQKNVKHLNFLILVGSAIGISYNMFDNNQSSPIWLVYKRKKK